MKIAPVMGGLVMATEKSVFLFKEYCSSNHPSYIVRQASVGYDEYVFYKEVGEDGSAHVLVERYDWDYRMGKIRPEQVFSQVMTCEEANRGWSILKREGYTEEWPEDIFFYEGDE